MGISPTTGHETSSKTSNPSNATALALIYDEYGQQHQTEAQTISNTIKIEFFRLFLFSAAFIHSKRTTTRAEGYTTAVSDPIACIAAVAGATLLVTKQTELVYVYFSFFHFFFFFSFFFYKNVFAKTFFNFFLLFFFYFLQTNTKLIF